MCFVIFVAVAAICCAQKFATVIKNFRSSKRKDKTGNRMALAKVNFATKNRNSSSNIFLDMLKVAPLVELADEDAERTSSQSGLKFEGEEGEIHGSTGNDTSFRSFADVQSSSFTGTPLHDNSTICIDDTLMGTVERTEKSLMTAISQSESSLMEDFSLVDVGWKSPSSKPVDKTLSLPVFIPLSSTEWPENPSSDGIQNFSSMRKKSGGCEAETPQGKQGGKRSSNGKIRTKTTPYRQFSTPPQKLKQPKKKKAAKLSTLQKLRSWQTATGGVDRSGRNCGRLESGGGCGEKHAEEVVLGEDSDMDTDDVIFVGEVTPPPPSSNISKISKASSIIKRSSLKGRHVKWARKEAKVSKNKAVHFAMSATNSEMMEECIPAPSTAVVDSPPKNEDKKRLETTFISRIRPAYLSPPVPSNTYMLHGLRYFENIEGREVASAHQFRPESFKLVSYNVLSQETMQRTRFLYTHLKGKSTRFGVWGQRFRILSAEFDRLRADVFCLQEVDAAHMESFYRPFFEKLGYAGIYCRKTNKKPDGCAIFYSATKFYPRMCFEVFYNLNVEPMNCDNVGQVLALEILGTKSVVCIANTHLVYNPMRGSAKISQIAFLFGKMNEMEQLIRAEMSPEGHFVGHILCGDFNMEPFSPIYRFIVDSKLKMHKFSSQDLARSLEELEIVGVEGQRKSDGGGGAARVNLAVMRMSSSCTFQTVNSFPTSDASSCKHLTHSFKLASVYEHKLADSSKEISFRPVDEELCPDFIFYSVGEPKTSDTPIAESYIQLRGRLTLPCLQDLDNACGPMPNGQTGSDHLPILAHFHLLCK